MCMFNLEKLIWTESDFLEMGWHDSIIYSSFAKIDDYEFVLDLDYIFNRVKPELEGDSFNFWVSPVTMVFQNVSDIKVNIESQQGEIEVSDLLMESPELTPNGKYTSHIYRFECQQGSISLRATGFKMYVKQLPKFQSSYCLTLKDRNGITFVRECTAL
ncbi:hypothetical protein CW745_16385 [Psychromonas sp. psych-6C06]|nr:hypothetical protein CW745_16385 [Psychromonas sp. psych-6C06]